jgi:hypothetical protein
MNASVQLDLEEGGHVSGPVEFSGREAFRVMSLNIHTRNAINGRTKINPMMS